MSEDMRRFFTLGKMSYPVNQIYVAAGWPFGSWRILFAIISTIFLSVTARAQAPLTLIAGDGATWQQARLVRLLQDTKSQSAAGDFDQLAAEGDGATPPGKDEKQSIAKPQGALGDSAWSTCGKGVAVSLSASAKPKPLSAVEECNLKAKDVFKECNNCPEMIVVPAGGFTMGSPEDEPDRNKNEGPQHKVTFAQPFAVGRFAVTFDEWDACVSDGGCNGYKPNDQSWGRGRRPVIHVSWYDAQAYVTWLSKVTGKTYRLLTEAEREYVTRAGTTTPFWFGRTITFNQANFDNSKHPFNNSPMGGRRGETLPVDAFLPNPWGLYQVHGNVWDWVQDCFNGSYVGAPTDGSAWMTGDCSKHVLRGGSWTDQPRFLRSAFRLRDATSRRYDLQGFRVARTLGP